MYTSKITARMNSESNMRRDAKRFLRLLEICTTSNKESLPLSLEMLLEELQELSLAEGFAENQEEFYALLIEQYRKSPAIPGVVCAEVGAVLFAQTRERQREVQERLQVANDKLLTIEPKIGSLLKEIEDLRKQNEQLRHENNQTLQTVMKLTTAFVDKECKDNPLIESLRVLCQDAASEFEQKISEGEDSKDEGSGRSPYVRSESRNARTDSENIEVDLTDRKGPTAGSPATGWYGPTPQPRGQTGRTGSTGRFNSS